MRTLVYGLLVALGLNGVCAAQTSGWGAVYGYIGWASDYRFYGASESNRQPAVQGGLHWLAPANFYAGVFVSQIDFKDFRNTNVETDFYVGRHISIDENDLNIELLYAVYPDSAGHPSYAPDVRLPTYNFIEPSVALTRTFDGISLSGKLLWEPPLDRFKRNIWSTNLTASYPITAWLKASADAGHQWSALGVEGDYWDAGVTVARGWQWSLDIRYYGSDIARARCYGTNWCEAAIVAKLTYTFPVL